MVYAAHLMQSFPQASRIQEPPRLVAAGIVLAVVLIQSMDVILKRNSRTELQTPMEERDLTNAMVIVVFRQTLQMVGGNTQTSSAPISLVNALLLRVFVTPTVLFVHFIYAFLFFYLPRLCIC